MGLCRELLEGQLRMLQGFTLRAERHVAQARATVLVRPFAETAATEAPFARATAVVAAFAELAAGSTLAVPELAAPARRHGFGLLHPRPIVATHGNNRLGRGLRRCSGLRRRLRLTLCIDRRSFVP